jgi:hypothetical protein
VIKTKIEGIIEGSRHLEESLLTDSSRAATEIIKLFQKEGWVKQPKVIEEVYY